MFDKDLSAKLVFYTFEDGKKIYTNALFYFHILICSQIQFHTHHTVFALQYTTAVQLHTSVLKLYTLNVFRYEGIRSNSVFTVLSTKGLQKCREVAWRQQTQIPYYEKKSKKSQFEIKIYAFKCILQTFYSHSWSFSRNKLNKTCKEYISP